MTTSPCIKTIIEAALLAAGEPLPVQRLAALFAEDERPDQTTLLAALQALHQDYSQRGIELVEVADGWRLQVRPSYAPWVGRLWEEKPGRYSRALLETLALIAYRQPITRGEIADIRGVTVSTTMMRTLQERGWIRRIGHREVPGRPGLYGTTNEFLNYFNLKSLSELPPLPEPEQTETTGTTLELTLATNLEQHAHD